MKFNKSTKQKTVVENYEGEKAFVLSPELDLYSSVVTTSLSNKFYEGGEDRLKRIRALMKKVSAEFVAKLAVYAREKMYLRSVPLVLAVELAKIHKGDSLVGRLVNRIVQRADEITELLAYYQQANEREDVKKLNKLSKQIRVGIGSAFNKFDEYQFAKYNRKSTITLKDALFISHPKAKDKKQQALFDKIVKDELEVPYTWEVELSKLGQKKYKDDEAKKLAFKKKWEELIDSDNLGYMALLRNLRNILQAKVSQKYLAEVAKRLGDKKEVEKSKQLPFRFLAAYRELKNEASTKSSMILDALEEAIQCSAANIKGYDYETSVLIGCDTSGSMETTISEKSKVQNFDIGLVLGMLLQSRCKAVISGIFGDTWKVINLPKNNVLGNSDELHRREGEVGYSTNGYLVIQDMIDRDLEVDKVMIFTDCQLWNSYGDGGHIADLWQEYKEKYKKAKLYLFDLAGYGNTPLSTNDKDVYFIAGWSDKVFDILAALEKGSSAIEEIDKIEL
jgi:hypothetical protein